MEDIVECELNLYDFNWEGTFGDIRYTRTERLFRFRISAGDASERLSRVDREAQV